MLINKNNINKLFYSFLIIHLILWTLIPTLTNNNLPLDTIEALAWGSNLDWGFNKHPPASAFFPEVVYQLFGSQDWAYYLLSQLFVVTAFIIVFKFAEELFKNHPLPTAIIAGNDVIAKGIIYAAQANGLNVPGDISITGIGDFSSSESSFPSITTVRMRPNKVGVKAANVLLERINGDREAEPIRIKVSVEVKARESTKLITN